MDWLIRNNSNSIKAVQQVLGAVELLMVTSSSHAWGLAHPTPGLQPISLKGGSVGIFI